MAAEMFSHENASGFTIPTHLHVRTRVALRTDRALFCGGDGALAIPARAAFARSVQRSLAGGSPRRQLGLKHL